MFLEDITPEKINAMQVVNELVGLFDDEDIDVKTDLDRLDVQCAMSRNHALRLAIIKIKGSIIKDSDMTIEKYNIPTLKTA